MGKNTDKIFNNIYSSKNGKAARRAQHKWEEKDRKLKDRHNKYLGTNGKEKAQVISVSQTEEGMAGVHHTPEVGGVIRIRPEHMDSVTPSLDDSALSPVQQNKNVGMQPLRLVEIDPENDGTIMTLQAGGQVSMEGFGKGSLETDGNTNHSRASAYQPFGADGLPLSGQSLSSASGAFSSGASGTPGPAGPLAAPPPPGDNGYDYTLKAGDVATNFKTADRVKSKKVKLIVLHSTDGSGSKTAAQSTIKRFAGNPTISYTWKGTKHPLCADVIAGHGSLPDGTVCKSRPAKWYPGRGTTGNVDVVEKKVSTSIHYATDQGGNIIQGVLEKDVAYHAGNSNGKSIGIEMCGKPKTGPGQGASPGYSKMYDEVLLDTTAKLVADICRRHQLTIDRNNITGHEDLNPSRRSDPGTRYGPGYWDWGDFLGRVKKHAGV
jgi:hypothetical protein